jgi:regulator of replication initiation timing
VRIRQQRLGKFRTISHNKQTQEKMNNNFQKVMDAIAEMKQIFSAKVATSFSEATLLDGTTIQYEGELAVGTPVFVMDTDMNAIPASEGTYDLAGDMEGVQIVVDADGIITEVIDAREEAPADVIDEESAPIEEAMSAEKVEEIISAKLGAFSTSIEKIAEMMSAIVEENESFKSEIETLKNEFTAFKGTPTDATNEKNKFSRQNTTLTARQKFLLNNKND